MAAPETIVLPKRPRTKEDVSTALSDAWFRTAKRVGKGALADATGAKCTKTIDSAIAGRSLPELHTALNSLLADPTALDEVFSLYGGRFVSLQSEAANDLRVIAGLNDASSEWLTRIIDGIRCKRDSKALAEIFRPLVAHMQTVIEEAEAA